MTETDKPAFALGQIVITPGAEAAIGPELVADAILRHQSCDWKGMSPESIEENEHALRKGGIIHSDFVLDWTKIWVITNRERSLTTVLLPDEY
jgi:hypothetical protein